MAQGKTPREFRQTASNSEEVEVLRPGWSRDPDDIVDLFAAGTAPTAFMSSCDRRGPPPGRREVASESLLPNLPTTHHRAFGWREFACHRGRDRVKTAFAVDVQHEGRDQGTQSIGCSSEWKGPSLRSGFRLAVVDPNRWVTVRFFGIASAIFVGSRYGFSGSRRLFSTSTMPVPIDSRWLTVITPMI